MVLGLRYSLVIIDRLHTVVITITIMVIIVVVVVVIVIVIVVVVVVVVVVVSMLGDASRAEGDLGLCRAPVADALQLSRVIVVLVITPLRDSHDGAADSPATVRNVVVFQLCCDGHIADEHETTESEKLLSTHDF